MTDPDKPEVPPARSAEELIREKQRLDKEREEKSKQ